MKEKEVEIENNLRKSLAEKIFFISFRKSHPLHSLTERRF